MPASKMTGDFIVDVPASYNKSQGYPLILAFRGANVTAAAFRGYLNLAPVAGSDAIVVNPDCLNDAPTWDVARDLPFFDALLNRLESSYCVDQRRVFATGHGSGGSFANTLGCLRGNKLRGVAPLSGGPPPTGACQAAPAVWISQGNLDTMLGAGRANRDFWVQRNKCDGKRPLPIDPSPCVEYAGCDPGSAVRYCEYDGDLGLPKFAADGLWEFFKGL
jgi:polyhydroxybutyrate depolymerase